jgi:hypothetical protein
LSAESQVFFSHIDVSIPDLAQARPVWDALMHIIGAETVDRGAQGLRYVRRDADGVRTQFVILHPRDDAARGGFRIAFEGTSHEQIDEIAAAVRSAGAKNVDGPGYHPENDPTFYGVFFEDGCGTALEVCHHRITD